MTPETDFVQHTDQTPFQVTFVTKSNGILTKRLRLKGNTIIKDSSQCYLDNGFVYGSQHTLPSLAKGLRNVDQRTALIHGVCTEGLAFIVSQKKFQGQPNTITRTRKYFKYSHGPGLLMGDYDPKPGGIQLSEREYIDNLAKAHPPFAKAGYISTPSTSACIYKDGVELKGCGGGRHVYFVVKNASDIPRFGKLLFKRLWLAGLGYIVVSKSGAKLLRSIIDEAVFSPERLDFVAGAVCEDGLEQRLPLPICHPGDVLDTKECYDLTPVELAKYEKLVSEAKKAAEPEAKAARDYYIAEAIETLVNEGIDKETAERTIEARLNGMLHPKDFLHFDTLGKVSVADVLADPSKYDLQTLRDPVEYDYGAGKARFYANTNTEKPCVHSFAHGGRKFWLQPPVALDPNNPYQSAKIFIEREFFTEDGVPTLRYWQGQFYIWNGRAYDPLENDEMRAKVYKFLDRAVVQGSTSGYQPNKNKVINFIDALAAVSQIPSSCIIPCWLDDAEHHPAHELIAVRNGLLHLPTRSLIPENPHFFTLNMINIEYIQHSPPPSAWLKFLHDLWPNDPETLDTLHELLGYLLSHDTSQQKIFLLVGPKRSGKGTIARVITELLGRANVAGPTLSSLSNQFGLECLIGKKLGIISDARLGGRADQSTIAERLLSISGEDSLSIPRKYLRDYTAKLDVRFIIFSNELPRIGDASGALASRLIILQMTKSFFGKEDPGLTNKLKHELPGILNLALDGGDRLNDRGYFVQPNSAQESVQEMADLTSPIGAFLRDRCEVRPAYSIECNKLYVAWCLWCHGQGREHPGTAQSFGRDLKAADPSISVRQHRIGGERARFYDGVGLCPARTGTH